MFLYHVVMFKMLFICVVLREPRYSSVRWAFCPVYECRGELTHLKRSWCWKRLKAGGEGGDRGGDHWVASPTPWTWLWANPERWWKTGNLECCSPWGHRESDTTEQLNDNRQNWSSREPEPVPSTSGMDEIKACTLSPIADNSSAPPSPTSSPFSSQLLLLPVRLMPTPVCQLLGTVL